VSVLNNICVRSAVILVATVFAAGCQTTGSTRPREASGNAMPYPNATGTADGTWKSVYGQGSIEITDAKKYPDGSVTGNIDVQNGPCGSGYFNGKASGEQGFVIGEVRLGLCSLRINIDDDGSGEFNGSCGNVACSGDIKINLKG